MFEEGENKYSQFEFALRRIMDMNNVYELEIPQC